MTARRASAATPVRRLMTQADYWRHAGVTKRRGRQLIDMGLPVEPNRQIDATAADAWRAAHVRPYRRRKKAAKEKATTTAATALVDAATVEAVAASLEDGGHTVDRAAIPLDQVTLAERMLKVRRDRLRMERERGALIDRPNALARVYAMARDERDAVLALPTRFAAEIAAEVGCDGDRLYAALDRMVRTHLTERARVTFTFEGDPGLVDPLDAVGEPRAASSAAGGMTPGISEPH